VNAERPAPHPLLAELRRIRIDAGLKLATIAHRLGVSANGLNNWELGVRSPRFEVVAAWAAALGYDLSLRQTTFEVEPVTARHAAANRAVLALAAYGDDDDYVPGGAA
jgi:transcriptional regulator with XRE-family HTH domain